MTTTTPTDQVTVFFPAAACMCCPELPRFPDRLAEAGVLEEDFTALCAAWAEAERFKGRVLGLIILSAGICCFLLCPPYYEPKKGIAPFEEKYKDKRIRVELIGPKQPGFVFTVPARGVTAPSDMQIVRDK